MSRQYFADILSEPINANFATINNTAENVLIPTQYTTIPANEPRAGKVYELIVGGTITTGTSQTITLQPRLGTTISGVVLGPSSAQAIVASVTTVGFIAKYYLAYRSIGLGSGTSTCVGNGFWNSGGAIATAGSSMDVFCSSSGAVTVDTSTAQALWFGVQIGTAPTIIPLWHVWRSLN